MTQSLQNRIVFLENLLKQHGIPIPPDVMLFTESVENPLSERERYNPLSDNRPALDMFQQSTVPGPSNEQVANGGLMALSTEKRDLPRTSNFLDSTCTDLATNTISKYSTKISTTVWNVIDHGQQLGQPTSSRLDNLTLSGNTLRARSLSNNSWEDDDDEIMDQLSARMGAFQIAEDGQLRFFGATSNLHILHTGLSSMSRVLSRTVRAEGEEILLRAGLGSTINESVERHLEDLYFRWEDPSIHVVDEEMYFLAKADHYSGRDRSPFYSETLKNAMWVEKQK
jgi:hypothetical protein